MAEPFLGAPATTMTATSGEVGRAASELSRAASQLQATSASMQATSASMQSTISQMARGPMGAVAGMGVAAAGYSAFMGTGAGQALRGAGQGMVSPFVGAPGMMPMGPGQAVPTSGATFGRAFGASVGFVDPMESRRFGAGQTMAASQQRASQLAGDRMMAMMGGAGSALSIGADMGVGALITGGAMKGGLGMMAGMGLGMVGGMGVGAAVGFAADQTMRQATQMRALGQQVNQNAFRFMDPRAMSGGRMSSQQQLDVGRRLGRLGNEDLAFSQGEMSEILGTMQQNDLLRGVRNTDELVQAVRQGKETIKTIMRNMGQTIQEAGQTMAEMQGMGFDMRTPQGRAAIFGSGSVMGMGRGQAFAGAAAVGQQFVGQGLGQQMFGVGMVSQQLGQGAMMSGALSQRQIAQAGGREGVNQLFAKAIGNFVQTSEGKSLLAAGMQGGRFDFNRIANRDTMELLQQAGAGATQENILALAADPQAATREMLRTPERQAQTAMMLVRRAVDKARETLGPDASPADLNRAARIHMSQAYGISLQEAETMMVTALNAPESMKMAQRQGAATASNEIATRNLEQRSLMAQGRRWMDRLFEPAGAAVAAGAAAGERATNRLQENIREGFLGVRMRSMRAEDTMQLETFDLEKQTKGATAARELLARGERVRDKAAEVVERNYSADRDGAHALAEEINDSEPDRAAEAAEKLFDMLSAGAGDIPQHVLREEIAKKMGVPIQAMMGAGKNAGRVGQDSQVFGEELTEMFRTGRSDYNMHWLEKTFRQQSPMLRLFDFLSDESRLSKEQILTLGREKTFQDYVKAKTASDAASPEGKRRIKAAEDVLTKSLTKEGGMMAGDARGAARVLSTVESIMASEGGGQRLKDVIRGFETESGRETRQIANLGAEAGLREALGTGVEGLGGIGSALTMGSEALYLEELGRLGDDSLRKALGGTEEGQAFAATGAGEQLMRAVEQVSMGSSKEDLKQIFQDEKSQKVIDAMFKTDGLQASEVGALRRALMRGTGITGTTVTGADVGAETINAIGMQQQSLNNLDNSVKLMTDVLREIKPILQSVAGPGGPAGRKGG